MSLWWLQPGWTDALCGRCGCNIYASGGDPDHGVCFECFMATHQPEPMRQGPLCDICGEGEAVTDECGLGVCSEACMWEARERREAQKGGV